MDNANSKKLSKPIHPAMIPKNIKREHILKAIEEIDYYKYPERRSSKKFNLILDGKYYPPKLVISLANKFANEKQLLPYEFNGGKETNTFLTNLGFNIEGPTVLETSLLKISDKNREKTILDTRHDERCPKCKETIEKLLEKLYGRVEKNFRFDIGTSPENFRDTPFYNKLKEIYGLIQNYRGFKEFVRIDTLPQCDYFIPEARIIVEFDESQHFSQPRKIALSHYPENLKLGYDRKRWIGFCEKINSKDNNPPYRDEQRAWYDTLRDFLPGIINIEPTVRLFAKDFAWCSLDPNNEYEVRKFEDYLRGGTGEFKIEVREQSHPLLSRIIIAKDWKGRKQESKEVIEEVSNNWPKGKKVKFLITCGGFIQFDWPMSVTRRSIGDNKYPNKEAVEALVKEGDKCAKFILSNGLREKLCESANYLTLGIDSYKEKISTTHNIIGMPHIELVFLIDLKTNKYYWTGKSYPTSSQEKGLIRISDLSKHYFELSDVGVVLVLGCHDLTVFNPRSKNAKGWREKVNMDFRILARAMNPIIVLQHPHTTDSIWTWAAAWNGLKNDLPSVEIYASAGRYYNSKGERSKLEDVLKKTKKGNTIDFIIRSTY